MINTVGALTYLSTPHGLQDRIAPSTTQHLTFGQRQGSRPRRTISPPIHPHLLPRNRPPHSSTARMAIINTLPGVSVSIDSDGVLPEHCDPDTTDLPCVATRYVQAQTGQRFTVRCNVSSGGVAIVGTYAIRPLVFSDLVVSMCRWRDFAVTVALTRCAQPKTK